MKTDCRAANMFDQNFEEHEVDKFTDSLDEIHADSKLAFGRDSSTARRLTLGTRLCMYLENEYMQASAVVCTADQIGLLQSIRRTVEDFRVDEYAHLSAEGIFIETGVTENVCHYMTTCLCDYVLLRQGHEFSYHEQWIAPPVAALVAHGCVICNDTAMRDMTVWDVECSLEALLVHEKRVPWHSLDIVSYVSALQLRAAVLLVEHTYGRSTLPDYEDMRAQWSCASAELKRRAIRSRVVGWDNWDGDDDLTDDNTADVLTPRLFKQWLLLASKTWQGDRFRTEVSAAFYKRSLRCTENGRHRAFEGQSTKRRSRGATDMRGPMMASMNIAEVATFDDSQAVAGVGVLRDTIQMRLIYNAFNTINIDFMEQHVELDSVREEWRQHATNQAGLPPRIVEVNGMYELRGTNEKTPSRAGFGTIFCEWYTRCHAVQDPLYMIRPELAPKGMRALTQNC